MTPDEDARLADEARRKVRGYAMSHDGILMLQLADCLESQRREIEELRWDLDEALKVIAPFVKLADEIKELAKTTVWPIEAWAKSCTWEDLAAASAFAAKHGAPK